MAHIIIWQYFYIQYRSDVNQNILLCRKSENYRTSISWLTVHFFYHQTKSQLIKIPTVHQLPRKKILIKFNPCDYHVVGSQSMIQLITLFQRFTLPLTHQGDILLAGSTFCDTPGCQGNTGQGSVQVEGHGTSHCSFWH